MYILKLKKKKNNLQYTFYALDKEKNCVGAPKKSKVNYSHLVLWNFYMKSFTDGCKLHISISTVHLTFFYRTIICFLLISNGK